MTSRKDLDRLSTANRRVVELAVEQLRELFFNFDFSLKSPDLVRDALMEIVPAMVSQFGDVAATAAADWYEQTRRAQVSGDYSAVFGDEVDLNLVDRNVRWASQPLFQGDAAKTLSRLEGAMQRHISYSTRATIARNAEHDPAKPRYARVPQGTFTCAFCVMLASRGWVYPSEETAQTAKDGGAYHNHCDCMIVPEWDREVAHIEGYDPDRLYEMYQAGRAESGSQDPRDIAQAMRRLYPTQLSDGVDVVRGNALAAPWEGTRPVAKKFGGTRDLPGVFRNPTGADLYYHEYLAARQMTSLGHEIEWLPHEGRSPSLDFKWFTAPGIVDPGGFLRVELKSSGPARASAIKNSIRRSVKSAMNNHGFQKDVFLIDIGSVHPGPGLTEKLSRYNRDNPEAQISRLFVMGNGVLTEVKMA